MILNEIFNKPLSWSEDTSDSFVDKFKFKTKAGIRYNVNIFKIPDFRMGGINVEDSGIGIDFQNLDSKDMEGITGTGDQIEVFSTVLDIIEKAIKKHDPNYIAFGAHEKSRQKLYDRIISRLKSKYDYVPVKNIELAFPMPSSSKYYVFKKKGL